MENKIYACPQRKFSSYLAATFTSFVEYKVNVGGCVLESFIPELCRFDSYCLDHPETDICLKAVTVQGFLKQRTIKVSTLKRVESILRSFGKYMVLVLQVQDTYVLPKIINICTWKMSSKSLFQQETKDVPPLFRFCSAQRKCILCIQIHMLRHRL